MSGCCSPSRDESGGAKVATDVAPIEGAGAPSRGRVADRFVTLPASTFAMGSPAGEGYAADGENPVHDVSLSPFSIARHTVTNADLAEFVDATGFRTESEAFGWSFVFGGLLPDDFEETRSVADAPWWRQVFGADWRHPEGPDSSIEGRA